MNHISDHFPRVTVLIVLMLAITNLLQGCHGAINQDSTKPTDPELRLTKQTEGRKGSIVELVGLPPEIFSLLNAKDYDFETFSRLLAIYVTADDANQTLASRPLLGEFSIKDERLQLRPSYPFERGITYVAQAELKALDALLPDQPDFDGWFETTSLELTFTLPEPDDKPITTISNIFPSTDIVPENLLRFYVHFSGPMRRGEAFDHIRILDANGDMVERPFLRIGRELWNSDMTRLTVMLDPGRIKRGMAPNLQTGLPLIPGQSYQLIVDQQWEDANGNPLAQSYQKTFSVGTADFVSPKVTDWQAVKPRGNTSDPLVIHFPEPMDQALLHRFITVHYLGNAQDNDPTPVQGIIDVPIGEMAWHFLPTSPWQQGSYRLVIDTLLEDIAGNSLRRPFDTDLQAHIQEINISPFVELHFDLEADLD